MCWRLEKTRFLSSEKWRSLLISSKPPCLTARKFCEFKDFLENDFNASERQYYPIYLVLAVILIVIILENMKNKKEKIAG